MRRFDSRSGLSDLSNVPVKVLGRSVPVKHQFSQLNPRCLMEQTEVT